MCSACWRKDLARGEDVGAPWFIMTVNHRIRARKGSGLLALTSGGAIPENADYRVMLEPSDTLSARSMKISPWKAWRATFSSLGTPPGKF
jgi:hypothetical protein